MFNTKFPAILLTIFSIYSGAFGQMPGSILPASEPQIFRLSELKEGMRGTARTVFHGTKSEEFNVEILGVIPNWIGPRQDMIVGRLSGANAERTFVFAGMSGSPVYIDGKLVGAISYSFPFAKEPICGITPIEQMISTVVTSPVAKLIPGSPRTFTSAELLANIWRPAYARDAAMQNALASGFPIDSRLMAVAGQTFTPIATPISISGMSQRSIDMFASGFSDAGLMPVAAAGGGSAITPMKRANETTLLGGDSVVVHLARGDIEIAAAGTVTLRDGDKIYAFGHPFFSLGSTNLPMSESHVITVVPNANNSFKLAVPDATVGSLTQDRATGIFGKLGESPKMIPVKIRITTSRGQKEEVNFESTIDETLTALIINAGVGNALAAHERGLGESTIELNGEIKIKGENSIRMQRRFTGQQAAAFASSAPAIPVAALLRANFEGLEIAGVNLDMTASDGSRTAALERVSLDRNQVRAGETVEATVSSRTESGSVLIQKINLTIPKDTAPGQMSFLIGDGNAAQQNTAVTQFTPKSAAELIAIINRLKRPDRLYAILTRTTTGAIIGSSEMPNLPPSVLATLNNDRTAGGSKPVVQTIIAEMELSPLEYVVTGSQTLMIEVIR
ncbi:MAG: hypothetical protein ACKVQJ_13870 [Pyrinomonadaceae bacterium]